MIETPLAHSALHETYLKKSTPLDTRNGWQAPLCFGTEEQENDAVKKNAGFGECVGLGVLDVVGDDIPRLAEKLGFNQVAPGMATSVSIESTPAARWLQLTRHHARVTVPVGKTQAALSSLKSESCAHITDVSSGLTTFALVGPRSPDVLARLVRLDFDPRVFENGKLALTGSVGIHLQILRWDRNSNLVYELTVGRDLAEYFWESVFHASEDLGLHPLGMSTLTTLGIAGE